MTAHLSRAHATPLTSETACNASGATEIVRSDGSPAILMRQHGIRRGIAPLRRRHHQPRVARAGVRDQARGEGGCEARALTGLRSVS